MNDWIGVLAGSVAISIMLYWVYNFLKICKEPPPEDPDIDLLEEVWHGYSSGLSKNGEILEVADSVVLKSVAKRLEEAGRLECVDEVFGYYRRINQ